MKALSAVWVWRCEVLLFRFYNNAQYLLIIDVLKFTFLMDSGSLLVATSLKNKMLLVKLMFWFAVCSFDIGPLLLQTKHPVPENCTAFQLRDSLAIEGATLVCEAAYTFMKQYQPLGITDNLPRQAPRISYLWQTCLSGGERGDYPSCSVLYCVLKLCTVISTLRWAVLTVLWIGLCHTGLISLCVDLLVFICVYFVCYSYCIVVVLLWAQWDGPDGIEA